MHCMSSSVVQPKALTYDFDGRQRAADLYLPANAAPEAGVVLLPGVSKEGKRDARLVALARAFADAKFATLVPDLPNLRQLKVTPDDAQEIEAAFRYLITRPDLAPHGRAGIAAASYGVGPAVIAALDPRIGDRVRFVVGIGGYYDMQEVVTFNITGWYRDRTQKPALWRHMEQSQYGKWIFMLSNLDYVPSPHDRELLRQVAEQKLRNPAASVDALAGQLGEQGRVYYDLLTTTNPQDIPSRLARISPLVRRRIDELNLARRDLSKMSAELILIHGYNDQSIPYTESKELAAAAPKAKLYLVHNLAHVDLGKGGLPDILRLICAVNELLAQRQK